MPLELAALLSGAAGLVYEVLWARRLAQLCGSTALAQTLTLAVFLGGLAAGSARLGRRAGEGQEARRFYARLELLVAALGLAAPAVLAGADSLRQPWLAVVVLGAQAFLMGGAVPALCGAAGGEAQRGVGRVYAANSAGAVAGALGAGFALIPGLGLDWAFAAAAALNFLAALSARGAVAVKPAPAERAPKADPEALPAAAVWAAVFASGFVALTYETAWTRLLALVLGSSAYSFAEMLAALIAGLALGSALASSAAVRRRDPALVLAFAELGAGAAVLLTLPFYDRLPLVFVLLQGQFARTTAGFYQLEAAKFAFCALLLLPATVCLGLVLAPAVRLCSRPGDDRARSVGEVLAANTAGNVLGAFAGLYLLPWLGVEGVLRSGTTIHLAVGAALWLSSRPLTPRRRGLALLGLSAVLLWRARLPRWDPALLNQGLFRAKGSVAGGLQGVRRALNEAEVLFLKDDREATVTVLRYRKPAALALKVNGKTDASTGPDMRTQILLGELPLLLRPSARRALVIGWGSGVTAGSMLRHPLERLDAVELIPAVVEGARWFDAENGGAVRDPRLALHVADARSFLRRADAGPYDAIVSEPSNPWMAGVGDLFTTEFYERARAKLSPGGVMVQWLHSYEMDEATFRLTLRTFCAAFPQATLWKLSGGDLALVGSQRELAVDAAAMDGRFAEASVWHDFKRADMLYPATLLSLQTASDPTLRALAGTGPLNQERRPRLEYAAPIALFRSDTASGYRERDDRADEGRRGGLLLAQYAAGRGRALTAGEYFELLGSPRTEMDLPALRLWARDWVKSAPRDLRARRARRQLDELR